MGDAKTPIWERLYMPFAIALLAFGLLGMFSIGLPFFVLGSTMVIIWPIRHRRPLFQSLLVGALIFVVVGILVAPLGCTATRTLSGSGGVTVCDNILGLTYEGTAGYDPSLWPALAVGTAAGSLMGAITYLLLHRRRS